MELTEEKHYLGKLCPKGHEWQTTGQSRRFRSMRGCVACVTEKQQAARAAGKYAAKEKEWARANNERRTVQARTRYLANPEPFIAAQKRFYSKHKADPDFQERTRRYRQATSATRSVSDPSYRERENARNAEYRKNHPEVGRAALIRSRARRRNQFDGDYTVAKLAGRRKEFSDQCAYCGKPDPTHFDHFIPIIRGGRDGLTNILPACERCNLTKNAKLPYEWFIKQPSFTPERWDRILAVLGY